MGFKFVSQLMLAAIMAVAAMHPTGKCLHDVMK